MLGSGVFAGIYSRADADAITDIDGVRFGEALDGIGWRGEQSRRHMPLSAYLELHIEQGPILEAEDKTIGVVTGVQGVRWYEVAITGRESHAGTTPMPRRADALCCLRAPRGRGAGDRAWLMHRMPSALLAASRWSPTRSM